ncbi:tetratricopeptide repeat protein [Halobacteroides halobius DSM 5150]|uniref:Tetratricopeptide repeat protein n=1 Tax=Halobacteroides halobius (strain ATCC 35273 / DSM 5150 / MD-1) TaxID=748449 RepID=L0K7F0_HALHC|nr:tetratricopeptide repeat protein [Halobacteroides halobius]AGB40936.1 tetratricopeptide repeat protein [Halobacteroides halobius DSM 5150]
MKRKLFSLALICFILLSNGQIQAQSKFKPQWQKIITRSKRLLQKDSLNMKEKYKLAVAYANLGKIEAGNKSFKELGREDWKTKLKGVIVTYQKKMKQGKPDIQTINYLAFAYYIAKQYNRAEDLFQKIIQIDSKNIWSYNYLAVTQYKQEKYEQAEKNLKKSLTIEDNDYTHFLLGVNYYKQGNILKAMYHIGKGKKAVDLFF